MKIMQFHNTSPRISHVPGIVTMKRVKEFDDHGGGPFHKSNLVWYLGTGDANGYTNRRLCAIIVESTTGQFAS